MAIDSISMSRFATKYNLPNRKFDNNISFGNQKLENNVTPEEEEKTGKGKKIINAASIILWAGIVGGSLAYMLKRPKWAKALDKEKKLSSKLKTLQESNDFALKKSKGEVEKGNFWYRSSVKLKSWVDRMGEELFNNVLYAVGTLVIMPLVISCTNSKKSSKEDKAYAILRQPLSFATMFSIQLTMDQLFKRWNEGIVDQNLLEDKSILDKNGKIKKGVEGYTDDVLEKIKFNATPLKEVFENNAKKFAVNMTEAEKDLLFGIKDSKMQLTELENIVKNYIKDESKAKTVAEELKKSFTKYSNVKGKAALASASVTIFSNVIVSQVIGCAALNTIYGKVMKHREKNKEVEAKINEAIAASQQNKDKEVK